MGERSQLQAAAGGLLAVVLAVLLVWMVVATVGNAWATVSSNWNAETTQGQVVDVDQHRIEDGPEWRVDLEYTYTVEGTTYNGTTLYSSGENEVASLQAARAFREAHPEGSRLQVRYLPSDPGQSFLEESSAGWVLADGLKRLLFFVPLMLLALTYVLGPVAEFYPALEGVREVIAPALVYGVVAVLVIFLITGGLSVVGEVRAQQQVNENVATTDGQILDIRYYERENEASEYDDDEWVVDVTYSYAVEGTTYENGKVSPGGNEFDSEREAQNFLDAHTENTTATVYYLAPDPSVGYLKDPSQSPVTVALTSVLGTAAFLVVAGVVLLLALSALPGVGPEGGDGE